MTESIGLQLLVAAGLGLRHALDPDHLIAVAGLGAGGEPGDRRGLVRFGLFWGTGHALSLTLAGLAAIILGWHMQPAAQQGWEWAVGVAIVLIGVRLLIPRAVPAAHAHDHRRDGAGLRAALGIGALHGLAGTAGVTLTLLPLVRPAAQVPALVIFATMTCAAMVVCAALASRVCDAGSRRATNWRGGRIGIGLASVIFGVGYAAAA